MVDRDDPAPITVINLERVWVVANIFEHDLAGLQDGDLAEITVDAYPNHTFTGRVTYIGDEVDRSTRAVRARIEVPNPDHVLKPGMFARRCNRDGQRTRGCRSLRNPPSTRSTANRWFSCRSGDGGYAVRPVKLGSRGHDTVEILAGLKQGDQVVAKGGLALKTLIANKAAD